MRGWETTREEFVASRRLHLSQVQVLMLSDFSDKAKHSSREMGVRDGNCLRGGRGRVATKNLSLLCVAYEHALHFCEFRENGHGLCCSTFFPLSSMAQ